LHPHLQTLPLLPSSQYWASTHLYRLLQQQHSLQEPFLVPVSSNRPHLPLHRLQANLPFQQLAPLLFSPWPQHVLRQLPPFESLEQLLFLYGFFPVLILFAYLLPLSPLFPYEVYRAVLALACPSPPSLVYYIENEKLSEEKENID
jgi:hypothetical protein